MEQTHTVTSAPVAYPIAETIPTTSATVTRIHTDPDADLGFISRYADYADVLEVPRIMHEMVATQLVASILNVNGVLIPHGALTYPLDLWIGLLSASGAGRSTLVKMPRPILKAANLSGLIRAADWGSEAAAQQDISLNPTGLFVWGELSEKLKKLNSANFGNFKEWVTDRYNDLEPPANRVYRDTGHKGDTPTIEFTSAPRLSILATSSEDWFFKNLATGDSAGGFVPRWMLVRAEGPTRSVPTPMPLDAAKETVLADCLKEINKLRGNADLAGILRLYEEWYHPARCRFRAQPNPALADAYFNRHRDHVLKLAVIYEAAISHSLTVTERAWRSAQATARKLEDMVFSLLGTGMNAAGYELQKMEERVRKAGPDGISRSELTRAFQCGDRWEREQRLATLLEGEVIRENQRHSQGRTAKVYVHQEFLDAVPPLEYRA